MSRLIVAWVGITAVFVLPLEIMLGWPHFTAAQVFIVILALLLASLFVLAQMALERLRRASTQ
jgi:Kef-type K+ transport system membrane component KefB